MTLPELSLETDEVKSYPAYVGGRWIDATSDGKAPVFDPSTGKQIARVSMAGPAEVDDAVTSGRGAQRGWWESGWQARSHALHALADLVEEHASTLAYLDARNGGLTVGGAHRDIEHALGYFRYFAGIASELKGQTLEPSGGLFSASVREPYGVVGRIVPFNHPLQFAAAALAAPLAAGNAVVLKPAEQTPLSALHLAELSEEVLPEGLISVLPGAGPVGQAIVEHPRIHRIGFTGSVATGRMVMRQAAEHIKSVTLELGGKNPMIIGPDVTPQVAASSALLGMNLQRTAGQSCGSASRVYLHESHYEASRNAIIEAFQSLRVGAALDPTSEMGPLVSRAAQSRVLDMVTDAATAGGTVLCGGGVPSGVPQGGFFVEPTVIDGASDDATITQTEVFGPAVSLYRWIEEDDVLRRANSLPLGLTATIITNDLDLALRLTKGVEAGYVWINGQRQRPLGSPFGGYKLSGLGEENSLDELLSFTRTKNVNVDFLQ